MMKFFYLPVSHLCSISVNPPTPTPLPEREKQKLKNKNSHKKLPSNNNELHSLIIDHIDYFVGSRN